MVAPGFVRAFARARLPAFIPGAFRSGSFVLVMGHYGWRDLTAGRAEKSNVFRSTYFARGAGKGRYDPTLTRVLSRAVTGSAPTGGNGGVNIPSRTVRLSLTA